MTKHITLSIPFVLLALVWVAPSNSFAQEHLKSPVLSEEVLVSSGNQGWDVVEDQEPSDFSGETIDDLEADEWAETEGCCEKPFYLTDAFVGYRVFSSRNTISRAAHYEDVGSGAVAGASFTGLGKDLKLMVDGLFLSDRDYHGDVLTDYKGVYRAHVRTESFYHNQDHLPIAFTPFTRTVNYSSIDNNPADVYGLKVETNLAYFRYKMPAYPLHLNLNLWQLKREGLRQQIYSDHLFTTDQPNFVYSQSRRVDERINEFSFSIDGHAGYVDAFYGFTYRQLDDAVTTPRDIFQSRSTMGGVYNVINSPVPVVEHNAVPESRYYAHTAQVHTSLTGSLVSALSYTYAKRENKGPLSDTSMLSRPEDTIHSSAFDLNYTPDQHITLSVRYRFVDVAKENPAWVVNPFFTTPNIAVRPSIDFYRNSLTASAIYRPFPSVNIKAEYSGEFVNRTNTEYWVSLPEQSDLHKGTLTVNARPLKGLRLKALYSYSTTNNPAYDTSFGQRHEGQLIAMYTSAKKWGGTVNCRLATDKNDQITRHVVDSVVTHDLSRNREMVTTNANFWVTPTERVTLSLGYGLLWGSVDQMVLFQSKTPNSQADTDYVGEAQVYTVNATYQTTDQLTLSVGLQQIRSSAEFKPAYLVVGTGDTLDLTDISKVDTIENSFTGRAEYRLHKNFSCALDYSYSDYDSRTSSLFEGTVQKIMASMRTTW